jgi:hypothetical protein
MIQCQNCGNSITTESNYCRFCGTKFHAKPQAAPQRPTNFSYAPPRPYAWKTDEYQTQTEARVAAAAPIQSYEERYAVAPFFTCPNCLSQFPPRIERRISTTGWIIFAVLMVVFFPLFWIGLLMKEEVKVCAVCNARTT